MTAPSAALRRMKEGAAVVGGILFAILAGFLYQKLTGFYIGAGVFTYSLSYTIPVALCAAGAYLTAALQIRRMLLRHAAASPEPEEMAASEEDHYISEDISDDSYVLPEKEATEDPVIDAAGQRAEKIAAALAAQRGEEIDTTVQEESPSGEEDIWDAFYKVPPSFSEDAIEDFYADLPANLPQGYVLPAQDWEEEEEEPLLDEEIEEESIAQPLIWKFIPVVGVLLVLVGILWICASCWIGAGEDGFYAARMGSVRQYSWDQVTSYTIDAAFSSGEMQLCFQMKDGRQVKLSPASYAKTEAFADQYENLYQYWLHVDNILGKLGIEKTVAQREYLAETYRSREDGSWQYVQQLIGYEEDGLALS